MEAETQRLLELWLNDDQSAFSSALALAEKSAPQAYTKFLEIAGDDLEERDPEIKRIIVRMHMIGVEAEAAGKKIQKILGKRPHYESN